MKRRSAYQITLDQLAEIDRRMAALRQALDLSMFGSGGRKLVPWNGPRYELDAVIKALDEALEKVHHAKTRMTKAEVEEWQRETFPNDPRWREGA